MKPTAKPPMPKAARLRFQRLLARLGMLAVLALSMLLLWWSIFVRLAPVNRQYQEKTRELSGLADQVDQLGLQWPADKLTQLDAQYQDAQTLLFTNATEFADWGKAVQDEAALRGLAATFQLGGPQAVLAPGQTLQVTRASLSLQPARADIDAHAPYLRLLGFIQALGAANKRVDVLELSAGGNSNSIQQVSLVVGLWSQARSAK